MNYDPEIIKNQQEFVKAVDRSIAKHDELLSLSEWQAIEAEETQFVKRATWVVCAVIVGLFAYAFFR